MFWTRISGEYSKAILIQVLKIGTLAIFKIIGKSQHRWLERQSCVCALRKKISNRYRLYIPSNIFVGKRSCTNPLYPSSQAIASNSFCMRCLTYLFFFSAAIKLMYKRHHKSKTKLHRTIVGESFLSFMVSPIRHNFIAVKKIGKQKN